jgi:hypothetical protein
MMSRQLSAAGPMEGFLVRLLILGMAVTRLLVLKMLHLGTIHPNTKCSSSPWRRVSS